MVVCVTVGSFVVVVRDSTDVFFRDIDVLFMNVVLEVVDSLLKVAVVVSIFLVVVTIVVVIAGSDDSLVTIVVVL